VSGERIDDLHAADDLPGAEVFGPDLAAPGALRGHDHEGIPERNALEDAAVDGLIDEGRTYGDHLEVREAVDDLLHVEGVGAQLPGRGHEEVLHHLGGDDPSALLGRLLEQCPRSAPFSRAAEVHGVEDGVRVQEDLTHGTGPPVTGPWCRNDPLPCP